MEHHLAKSSEFIFLGVEQIFRYGQFGRNNFAVGFPQFICLYIHILYLLIGDHEWNCTKCRMNNRPWRQNCRRCRAPRVLMALPERAQNQVLQPRAPTSERLEGSRPPSPSPSQATTASMTTPATTSAPPAGNNRNYFL